MSLSKQRRWQLARIAEGKCGKCGSLRDGPYKSLCIACHNKAAMQARKRKGSKPYQKGGKGRPPMA